MGGMAHKRYVRNWIKNQAQNRIAKASSLVLHYMLSRISLSGAHPSVRPPPSFFSMQEDQDTEFPK